MIAKTSARDLMHPSPIAGHAPPGKIEFQMLKKAHFQAFES
jgi:hypothetical protein